MMVHLYFRLVARLLLAVLVLVVPLAGHAAPEKQRRIALVIGIGAYQNAAHLANPVNDARAIGDSLRRLDFDVTELYDPDYSSLKSGVQAFGKRAAVTDVAVVYYAGHGMQVNGENYLIPTDAKLERERDLEYWAMPLRLVLDEASQANRIGIVLLDSCRNNPFIERVARSMSVAGRALATTQGLARVDNVPRNTMVVMAAKADQIAEDGQEHSPFASALLAHFQIPGLELSLFFRSVRDTVLRATNNRQEPYVFSSLGAEPFYFYERPPNRPPVIGTITAMGVTDAAGPTPLGLPQPTDPDQDPLTVRFVGLPRFGEVRVDGQLVSINTAISAERMKTATYKPDGKTVGPAGTVDIVVEDGRGGMVNASLPIIVRSSHSPPVLSGPAQVEVSQQVLGIPPPFSPDGDTLTVIIDALPRGTVRNGATNLRTGDHVTPEELSKLTFWPEAGFSGPAGSLRYTVDNGHGGMVAGALDIDVGTPSGLADQGPEAALWATLRNSTEPAEFDAFLRLFPKSRYAAEARRQQLALVDGSKMAITTKPPDVSKAPAVGQDKPASPPVMTAMIVPSISTEATPPRRQTADTNRFQDCPTCPSMIRIAKGSFMMGLGAHEPEAQPAHHVEMRAFAIALTPVTVAEWKACIAAKGCNFLPRMRGADDRIPVHNVSWEDTGQYVAWLSRMAGYPYRLPSEAEWEYAARGGTTTRYWWGEQVGMSLANCADCGGVQDAYAPMPVDARSTNPFGLFDVLGGVAEWTADCWFPNYRSAPVDATPRDSKSCEKRVLRGGSFRSPHDEITVTSRVNYDASVRYIVNGFRVARDLQ